MKYQIRGIISLYLLNHIDKDIDDTEYERLRL